jgi:hypothetical protein
VRIKNFDGCQLPRFDVNPLENRAHSAAADAIADFVRTKSIELHGFGAVLE